MLLGLSALGDVGIQFQEAEWSPSPIAPDRARSTSDGLLPTGIFYAQGVKANVLFFDRDENALDLRLPDE